MAEAGPVATWGSTMAPRRSEGPGILLARLLAVHLMSMLAFVLADIAMRVAGTNRTMIDLYLALGGYVFGLFAVITSLAAVAIVVVRRNRRREWPWLFAHLGALIALAAMGARWMGLHIA